MRAAGWLLGLTVVTVAVRLADPTGWHGADDALYFSAAESVLAGTPIDQQHHHSGRMAMILPIIASVSLFGASPQSVIFPTLFGSVVCVVLVAILGRMVWGWREGIFAATVVSFLPSFRLYSTSAYPDIHACMWITAAVVLAVAATRARRAGWAWMFGVGSGMAVGLATSAKIFSATGCIPVCAAMWIGPGRHPRRRFIGLLSLAVGFAIFILAEGLFYLRTTDDFLFRYHTLQNVRNVDEFFSSTGALGSGSFLSHAWHRLTMPFDPDRSTWGLLALGFWPAAMVVLLARSRGRFIALWAVAAYVLIALAPVRIKDGYQIFPYFRGRHALTTCIPFALCLGWLMRYSIARTLQARRQEMAWPAALGAVVVASLAFPSHVEGIRHSHTKMLGLAIDRAILTTDWSRAEEIFVHPSIYARYRILFPESLRARLRVAVDDASPDWWRQASTDIIGRVRPLPAPGRAYLLATPAQLRAEPEKWDYGVTLPHEGLTRWVDLTPLVQMGQCRNKTIAPVATCDPAPGEPLIYLIAHRGDARIVDAATP